MKINVEQVGNTVTFKFRTVAVQSLIVTDEMGVAVWWISPAGGIPMPASSMQLEERMPKERKRREAKVSSSLARWQETAARLDSVIYGVVPAGFEVDDPCMAAPHDLEPGKLYHLLVIAPGERSHAKFVRR